MTAAPRACAARPRRDRTSVLCLVQLGIVCQADTVLVASIAPTSATGSGDGRLTMSLRSVDVIEGQQRAFASLVVPASPLPEEVSALLATLDQPAAQALSLQVRVPAGAAVLVDGAARGALPLPTPLTVTIGKHEVRVNSAPAYVVIVEVRPGEPVEVSAPVLAPELAPVLEPEAVPPSPVGAIAVSPSDARAPSLAWPVTIAAASVTAIGAVALVVGLLPFVGYQGHAATLERLEADIGADSAKLALRLDEVTAERAALDADADAWNSYGLAVAVACGAVVLVGASTAIGALVLME